MCLCLRLWVVYVHAYVYVYDHVYVYAYVSVCVYPQCLFMVAFTLTRIFTCVSMPMRRLYVRVLITSWLFCLVLIFTCRFMLVYAHADVRVYVMTPCCLCVCLSLCLRLLV